MVGEKQQYRPKETMAVAPKQYRNQIVDVPVGQLGSDLRESRWSGKGLIVEVAENGKRRVSWDNSKGGKSSFKWVIRASTEQKPNPFYILSRWAGREPHGLSIWFNGAGKDVEERERWKLLCLSVVGSPATVMQTGASGGLLAQPECASPVGESGCTENLQHLVFRHSFDRNSILGSNRSSGGLVSEDIRSVSFEFVLRLVGLSFPDLFLEFLRARSMGFGVSGKEANSSVSKELLRFPRERVEYTVRSVEICGGFESRSLGTGNSGPG
nr:hypothetical protein CFP56_29585 [Quercus suber]